MSKAGQRPRPRGARAPASSVTPRLVLGATSSAMSRAAAASVRLERLRRSRWCRAAAACAAARQAARFARRRGGAAEVDDDVRLPERRGQVAREGHPIRRDRRRAPRCRARARGCPGRRSRRRRRAAESRGATRSSARPMRPLTPMSTRHSGCGRRANSSGALASLRPAPEKKRCTPSRKPFSRGACRRGVGLERLLELSDELALLGRQVHRGLDHDAAEQVAARPAAHRLHALVAQAKDTPGLRLGGNLELSRRRRASARDAAAEGGGGKAHRHLAAQVLAVALEDRRARARGSRRTGPRTVRRCGRPRPRPRGARDRPYRRRRAPSPTACGAAHAPLPEAVVTGIADDAARAAAARTGLLQLEEALGDAHLAGAAAGVAGGRDCSPWRRPCRGRPRTR